MSVAVNLAKTRRYCARALSAVAIVGGLAGLGTVAVAADFPSKQIEIIIPTKPGGGTDGTMRLLADLAEPSLGQEIVPINRPGASGTIGVTALTSSDSDGHLIAGVWFAPLTVAPHMLPTSYAPEDYTPISMVVVVPLVMCVDPDFPANTGAEMLDELRRNPERYTYGTDGIGGAAHLAAVRILKSAGAGARDVPFTDSGEILKNFLGGHIDIYVGVIGKIQPHLADGKAKCLILTTRDGNPKVPQAAGLGDLGYGDAATLVWRGVIGPKNLAADHLAVLEKAFQAAAQSEKFRTFIETQGGVALGTTSAEFREQIDKDFADFGKIIKELGIEKK